jgi:hypothetical protein
MWLSFWLNNSHFALEFFGAAVFFILAWLSFDAFLIKKEFKTFSLSAGFLFMAMWGVANSLGIVNDFWLAAASAAYIIGLIFILINLWLDRGLKRPVFTAVIVLPAMASVLWQVNIVASALLLLIVFLAFKALTVGEQKLLKPFFIGFSFLVAASIFAVFSARINGQGFVWGSEHILKLFGFCFLLYWGWQYLKLRIKEEMLLIFVGMALFISVVVTFTFSAVLLKNMENEAKANLSSNTGVLGYTFSRMKNEAKSVAELIAKDKGIINALATKNFSGQENTSYNLMVGKSIDFLTVADNQGDVVLRAHSVTAVGDNIKGEQAGGEAMIGKSFVTLEETQTEGLSIRGSAPIYDAEGKFLGVIITGFIIDNAFVDSIKKSTGVDVSVYSGDTLQATTILGEDGKSRNIGIKITDKIVKSRVLEQGQELAQENKIFSRPYLVSYSPLKDAKEKTVGMLQSARSQTGLFETAVAASRLTLLITIIITLMTLMPFYYVAKKISEDV